VTAAADPGAVELKPSTRAWYALWVMIAATIVGFVDREVLVLVAEPLKHEIGLTDGQFGILLGLGPGLIAAAGAIALGWLSDRLPRQLVLAGCVLAWSIATAASGLAANFPQLLLATLAIALGEAALTPVIFSMVPDLFPGRSRTTANFVIFAAVILGAGLGFALGGGALALIDSHRASLPAALRGMSAWRIAFFFVAVPGVPISLAVAAIGSVHRTVSAAAEQQSGSLQLYLRQHGAAVGGIYAASSLSMLGAGAAGWLPIYIMRTFKATQAEVGLGLGAVVGGGALAGLLISGFVVRRLSRRLGHLAAVTTYVALMTVSIPPLALQVLAQTPTQSFILYGLQIAASTGAAALVPNMLQDVSPAGLRGRVLASWTLVTSLATALAPVLVGGLSDALTGRPHALIWAIVLVGVPSLVAGVLSMRLTASAFRGAAAELAPA
jgi:MFS family permease